LIHEGFNLYILAQIILLLVRHEFSLIYQSLE
jgi:hypothetical protein